MSKNYDTAMMKTAFIWADESYCKRKKVGAVLAKKGRPLSCGYNGTTQGADNCCEEYDGKGISSTVTKRTVLHAEANALSFAGKYGIKTKGCTMYITLSPCLECAKLMAQHGIKKVLYNEEYRNTEGIEYLKENNIKVKQVKI
jgi:dCMP deaminase